MIRAIPTDDKQTVSKVFGRATYFALSRGAGAELEFLEGTSNAEHGAGTGAAALLAGKGVTEVLGAEFGPKANEALMGAGIAITIVKAGTSLAEALKR